jgi:hypothetical protein
MNPTRPSVLLRLAAAVLCLGVAVPATAAVGATTTATPSVSNSTPPALSGTVVVGHTIAFSNGIWSPSGLTFTYQWKVAGVDIAGATASSFPLTADYLDKVVSATVTGSKTGYSPATVTAVAGTVTAGAVVNNTPPTVNGTPAVGHILGLSTGSWSPSGLTFAYQWKVDGVDAAGATAATFRVKSAYVGKVISVSLTGSRTGYTSLTATASTTVVQRGTIVNSTRPTVNGTPKVGRTLGMSTGSWSPGGLTFAYQWLLDGKAMGGHTQSTLKVRSTYKGKRISVRVTASRLGYVTTTAVSAQRAKVTS